MITEIIGPSPLPEGSFATQSKMEQTDKLGDPEIQSKSPGLPNQGGEIEYDQTEAPARKIKRRYQEIF
jgi:hypothetical protein